MTRMTLAFTALVLTNSCASPTSPLGSVRPLDGKPAITIREDSEVEFIGSVSELDWRPDDPDQFIEKFAPVPGLHIPPAKR